MLPGSPIRVQGFLQVFCWYPLCFFFFLRTDFPATVDKSTWNLFMWKGAERHPFVRVCTVVYTLLSLCTDSHVYLGYPRHKDNLWAPRNLMFVCKAEGTGPTAPQSTRCKPALLKADLSKPWDKNLLLQLLLCNAGEHPSQNTFLAGKVTVPAVHPAVLYYTTAVNRKCKEQNSLRFCAWVIVRSQRQSS